MSKVRRAVGEPTLSLHGTPSGVWRQGSASLRRRVVFAIGIAILALAISAICADHRWDTRWFPVILTVWDALVGAYVLSTALMFSRGGDDAPWKASKSRGWTGRGEYVRILTIVIFVVVAGLLILIGLRENEQKSTWTLTAAIIAVISSWLAIHAFHAEYYAEKYYKSATRRGGRAKLPFAFPDDEGRRCAHGYLEFSYFALAIGSTFGTTDIEIYSKVVRKAVLLHALVSFWYNVAIIAVVFALATA